MPTFGVYIGIEYIMPTIGGGRNLLGAFGPFGPRIGGFMSFDVDISIVHIMPTIGGYVQFVVHYC